MIFSGNELAQTLILWVIYCEFLEFKHYLKEKQDVD